MARPLHPEHNTVVICSTIPFPETSLTVSPSPTRATDPPTHRPDGTPTSSSIARAVYYPIRARQSIFRLPAQQRSALSVDDIPALMLRSSAPPELQRRGSPLDELPTYRLTPIDQLPPQPTRVPTVPPMTSTGNSFRSSPTRVASNLETMAESPEEASTSVPEPAIRSRRGTDDGLPQLDLLLVYVDPPGQARPNGPFTQPDVLTNDHNTTAALPTTVRSNPPTPTAAPRLTSSEVRQTSISTLRDGTRARRSVSEGSTQPQGIQSTTSPSTALDHGDRAPVDQSPLTRTGPTISIQEPTPIQHMSTFSRVLDIGGPASRRLRQPETSSFWSTVVSSEPSPATSTSRTSSAELGQAQIARPETASIIDLSSRASRSGPLTMTPPLPPRITASPLATSRPSTSSPRTSSSRHQGDDKENALPARRSREASGGSIRSNNNLSGAAERAPAQPSHPGSTTNLVAPCGSTEPAAPPGSEMQENSSEDGEALGTIELNAGPVHARERSGRSAKSMDSAGGTNQEQTGRLGGVENDGTTD